MANSYEILLAIGGKLSSSLTTSISGASKSLKGMESAAAKSSKGLGSINGVAATASKGLGSLKGAVVGLVGALGVTVGFGAMIDAASKTQDTTKQLETVLKSTGGVAGVTEDQALKLAASLGGVTTFGKNATLASENLLLTFTKIGKDIMPDATETVLNMSQALGQDTKSSAIQLGKALNDPLKGITALQRVGVSFTAQQKKQIETMVKVGDTAGAQKLILAELGTEFGGSAKAAGQTFSGQMAIAKNAVMGAMAQIGIGLLPVIQSLLPKLTDGVRTFANFVTSHQGDIKNAIGSIGSVFNAIASVVKTDVLPTISGAFSYIKTTVIPGAGKVIKDLTPTFMEIVSVVKNVFLPNIKSGFELAGNTIKTAASIIKTLGNNLNIVIPIVGGLAAGMATYKVIQIASNAATKAGMVIATLSKAWGTATVAISLLREGNSLAAVAQLLLNGTMLANPAVLVAIGIGTLIGVGLLLYKNWDTISKFLLGVWDSLKTGAEAAFGGIGNFVTGAFSSMWNGVKPFVNLLIGGINTIIKGLDSIQIPKISIPGIGDIGGVGINIPQIPQLKAGGIVSHRPGGILANIGEGSYDEAVVPLKPGGSTGNGGGTQITWSPQIIIQGNASKDDVKEALNDSQRDFEQKMRIYEANKKRVSFA